MLGRIQPKNQNHIRWPNRKNLTWRIIYKVLERQLKQPGERWGNQSLEGAGSFYHFVARKDRGSKCGPGRGCAIEAERVVGLPGLCRTTGVRVFLEGAIETWSHCLRCLLKQREGDASCFLPLSPLQSCPRVSCLPSLTKMPLARKSGNHSLQNWASHKAGRRVWMCTERLWEQNGNNQQR